MAEHHARHLVAAERELGDQLAGDLLARDRGRCPSSESGSSSAATVPSRPIAVPEATASRQPWLGQLPWQRGPSSSITM